MKKSLFLILLSVVLAASSAWAQLLLNTNSTKSWRETIEVSNNLPLKLESLKVPGQVYPTEPMGDVDPNLVIDDGTRIMGNIAGWSQGPFYGIASMRPVDGTPIECVSQLSLGGGNWTYADGKYYGTLWQSGYNQVMKATYYVYDAQNWSLLQEVKLEPQWYNISTHMAYNPKDGKIYAIAYDGLKRTFLSTLNKEDGTYEHLVMIKENISAMAFDANGVLYALTSDGNFKTIDLQTAVGTTIASINKDGFQYEQSLAFDYHTGKLYWIGFIGETWKTHLSTIDPKTGKTQQIANLPSYMTICGLWIDSPKAEAKAPNTVDALIVDFGSDGSLEGTINVTAPKTAFDGSALSGDVSIEVKVDGTSVKKQTVKAGEELSFTHNFGSEGQHKVVATASNAVGGSPEGTITVFCGQDTPIAPSNVELAVDKTGKATLSWDAVTKGVNGGYIDAEQVAYNITRQPDNTVVAENFKELTFTEQLPDDVKRYSYTVVAIFGGKTGAAATSNDNRQR